MDNPSFAHEKPLLEKDHSVNETCQGKSVHYIEDEEHEKKSKCCCCCFCCCTPEQTKIISPAQWLKKFRRWFLQVFFDIIKLITRMKDKKVHLKLC